MGKAGDVIELDLSEFFSDVEFDVITGDTTAPVVIPGGRIFFGELMGRGPEWQTTARANLSFNSGFWQNVADESTTDAINTATDARDGIFENFDGDTGTLTLQELESTMRILHAAARLGGNAYASEIASLTTSESFLDDFEKLVGVKDWFQDSGKLYFVPDVTGLETGFEGFTTFDVEVDSEAKTFPIFVSDGYNEFKMENRTVAG